MCDFGQIKIVATKLYIHAALEQTVHISLHDIKVKCGLIMFLSQTCIKNACKIQKLVRKLFTQTKD